MLDFLTPSIRSLIINGCLIILALTVAASILVMIGGNKIFEKANKNKVNAYIPILNLFVLLELTDMSSFWGILFFIPIFNILAFSIMFYKLGVVFNAPNKYKIGLVLFPLCFYPLLAYSDYKYKISDEEYFKALDNARGESINLLTPDEIKEQSNATPEEPKEKIDSVFKSDMQLKEPVGPYKAQKVDAINTKPLSDEVENPFKPIEIAKVPEVIKEEKKKEEAPKNKFVEDPNKKEEIEVVDL